jgi:hypothetical protein
MPPMLSALLAFVVSLFRSRASLRLEHLALRHQLAVCQQTVHCPRLSPSITRSRMPPTELVGIDLPECPAPIPHRLVHQDDAALRHELFDISIAEAE